MRPRKVDARRCDIQLLRRNAGACRELAQRQSLLVPAAGLVIGEFQQRIPDGGLAVGNGLETGMSAHRSDGREVVEGVRIEVAELQLDLLCRLLAPGMEDGVGLKLGAILEYRRLRSVVRLLRGVHLHIECGRVAAREGSFHLQARHHCEGRVLHQIAQRGDQLR